MASRIGPRLTPKHCASSSSISRSLARFAAAGDDLGAELFGDLLWKRAGRELPLELVFVSAHRAPGYRQIAPGGLSVRR